MAKRRRSKFSRAQLQAIHARNLSRYDQQIQELLPAVRKALSVYLAALSRRVDQSAFGLGARPPQPALTAAAPALDLHQPSPFTDDDAHALQQIFDRSAPEWAASLESNLLPGIKAMLGQIPLPAEDPAVLNAANAWRSEWLAERTQVLVGVPDVVTAGIRTELDRLATESGTSVFDAKTAVKSMLGPERLDWEAERIARTEVVSANNQGMLASWRALIAGMGGGAGAAKTWVGGSRPSHSAVSGTTVGIEEKFHVGDSEMDGPGDSAGGAGECANCRCSLAFELDDSAQAPTASEEEDPAGQPSTAAEDPAAGDARSGGDAADDAAGEEVGTEADDVASEDSLTADYGSATDDELAAMLSGAAADEDETAINRILDELDRRDRAASQHARDAERAEPASAEDAARNAKYEALVKAGADAEEAFNEAYGVGKVADTEKSAALYLRSLGYTGRRFTDLLQAVFKEEADRMYWLAQEMTETKGFLLNKAGEQAGIDPRSLFTGREDRARKYASDELLAFWAKYTRITVDDVKASLLGGTMRSAGTAAWI